MTTENKTHYALRISVLRGLNHYGDSISYITRKGYDEKSYEDLFATPSGAEDEYYLIGSGTCPSNLLQEYSEIYDGPDGDPYGVIIPVAILPRSVIEPHVSSIFPGQDNSSFFNKLIRIYKSLYHMVGGSILGFGSGLGEVRSNDFGQMVYFNGARPLTASRINYIAYEILKNPELYLDLMENPQGTIVDTNQFKTNAVDEDQYNGLIYGFPELLLGEKGLGLEKVMDILGMLKAEKGARSARLMRNIIKCYYESDLVQYSYKKNNE